MILMVVLGTVLDGPVPHRSRVVTTAGRLSAENTTAICPSTVMKNLVWSAPSEKYSLRFGETVAVSRSWKRGFHCGPLTRRAFGSFAGFADGQASESSGGVVVVFWPVARACVTN
jgi:hypothetical protein